MPQTTCGICNTHIREYIRSYFIEINGGIGVADCIPDSYILDHYNVLCKLSLKREDIQRKMVTYRKRTDIDTEEMAKHIKAASGSEGNLDERARDFNNALTSYS